MKHAKDYEIVISDEGIPLFAIPYCEQKPEKPVLLYDGGNHATLFRSDNDVILLDYLPEEIRPVLDTCGWVVMIEKNKTSNDVARDYKVLIKKIKNNPLVDGL